MPKSASGGKRRGGGGGLSLQLRSAGFTSIDTASDQIQSQDGLTVQQIEHQIMGENVESVAIFGNDRRVLTTERGTGGEVTLSAKALHDYRRDIRIMSHNHPVELALSTGDLMAAARLGEETSQNFEELRAIAKSGKIYRALRPKSGQWPTQDQVSQAIQQNIRPAYERALQARRTGASKEEAFQIYQDQLTQRIAKQTGIQLQQTSLAKNLSLNNASQQLRSLTTGKPTNVARSQYGMKNIVGEKATSFPIFDTQSALAAIKLRGHAKTQEGRRNVLQRAAAYTPLEAQNALSRDLQRQGIDLQNLSQQLRSRVSGRPTSLARQEYSVMKGLVGEKQTAFPIFDVKSAESALKLQRFAKTEAGRRAIQQRAQEFLGTPVQLHNISQEMLRSPISGKPTAIARKQYSSTQNILGETIGSFPIFDEQSARAALHLRGRTKTLEGRQAVIHAAKQFTPQLAEQAIRRDQQRGLSVQNMSSQLRSLTTGKPTAEARRQFGFQNIPGEKSGAFPIFDTQSATAAIKLRGHARTQQGRQNIIERASEYMPEASKFALGRDKNSGAISLSNISSESLRTQSGKPSAYARKLFSVGENGSFPIFDRESALAALNLRGHASSQAERRAIIAAARKYIPEQAQKALERDVRSSGGITLQNYSPYQKRYSDNLLGVAKAGIDTVQLAGQGAFKSQYSQYPKYQQSQRTQKHRQPESSALGTATGVVGGYYAAKVTGKVLDKILPGGGGILKYMGMAAMFKKGYDTMKKTPEGLQQLHQGITSGEINTAQVKRALSPKQLRQLSSEVQQGFSQQSHQRMTSSAFYLRSGINPLSAFSSNKDTKAAFWAVNPYTRKIPAAVGAVAGGVGAGAALLAGGPITAGIGGIGGLIAGGVIGGTIAHSVSTAIAKAYNPQATQLMDGGGGYISARTIYGGATAGAYAVRQVASDKNSYKIRQQLSQKTIQQQFRKK